MRLHFWHVKTKHNQQHVVRERSKSRQAGGKWTLLNRSTSPVHAGPIVPAGGPSEGLASCWYPVGPLRGPLTQLGPITEFISDGMMN